MSTAPTSETEKPDDPTPETEQPKPADDPKPEG